MSIGSIGSYISFRPIHIVSITLIHAKQYSTTRLLLLHINYHKDLIWSCLMLLSWLGSIEHTWQLRWRSVLSLAVVSERDTGDAKWSHVTHRLCEVDVCGYNDLIFLKSLMMFRLMHWSLLMSILLWHWCYQVGTSRVSPVFFLCLVQITKSNPQRVLYITNQRARWPKLTGLKVALLSRVDRTKKEGMSDSRDADEGGLHVHEAAEDDADYYLPSLSPSVLIDCVANDWLCFQTNNLIL